MEFGAPRLRTTQHPHLPRRRKPGLRKEQDGTGDPRNHRDKSHREFCALLLPDPHPHLTASLGARRCWQPSERRSRRSPARTRRVRTRGASPAPPAAAPGPGTARPSPPAAPPRRREPRVTTRRLLPPPKAPSPRQIPLSRVVSSQPFPSQGYTERGRSRRRLGLQLPAFCAPPPPRHATSLTAGSNGPSRGGRIPYCTHSLVRSALIYKRRRGRDLGCATLAARGCGRERNVGLNYVAPLALKEQLKDAIGHPVMISNSRDLKYVSIEVICVHGVN